MPQYYPLPGNWHGRGKVSVVYTPSWRNTFWGKLIPYRVGDNVAFCIRVAENASRDDCGHTVCEVFNGQVTMKFGVDGTEARFRSGAFEYPGSLAYYLCNLDTERKCDLFFTAQVLTVREAINQIVFGLLFGSVLYVALALIAYVIHAH